MEQEPSTFEASYTRLEQILEKMNSGKPSLEESLKLYEEADQLIASCTKRLNEAEKKIEILTKNRNGELLINAKEELQMQEFALPSKTMTTHTPYQTNS